ncbi:DUF7155 family protein [Mycolicibacterium helvum]|nr:hypothetical protein [Mycolicibacterium helvum]
MTTANTRARRIAVVGALAVAAAAVPAVAALTAPTASANPGGTCLAWFGSRGDGQCLSYSNNNVSVGTPQLGVWGPDAGGPGYGGGGIGVSTGPLLPGQTISIPLG